MWSTLTNKYNDERYLAHRFFKKLWTYKTIAPDSVYALEEFMEKFVAVKHLLTLQNITDLSNFLLLEIALTKLDPGTATAFENHITNSKITGIPSFDELEKVIKDRIKIFDRVRTTRQQPRPLPGPRTLIIQTSESCPLCNCAPGHHLYRCEKFQEMSVDDRYNFVNENKACTNCLSFLHKRPECKSTRKCTIKVEGNKICDKPHHSLLHMTKSQLSKRFAKRSETSATNRQPVSLTVSSHVLNQDASIEVLLPTSEVYIIYQIRMKIIRALLDGCSQLSFITAECCTRMNIPWKRGHSTVGGFGTVECETLGTATLMIGSIHEPDIRLTITAHVVRKITHKLPGARINALNIPENIKLADKNFGTPGEIQLLLGADVFSIILRSGKIPVYEDKCYAIETAFGYVISGRAPLLAASENSSQLCCVTTETKIENLLRKFWEIEEPDSLAHTKKSVSDIWIEEWFRKNIRRDEFGKYSIGLPFKEPPQESLGESATAALKRFTSLERKFGSETDFRDQYSQIIRNYIRDGHVSEIQTADRSEGYFIPHHGVLKPESLTTPLRVVFDASAKTTSGKSLNDILHPGPKLQPDLRSILLRFWYHKVALAGDMRQMYHQVSLQPEFRKFLLAI